MKLTIKPTDRLTGELTVPGDKSISHRAIILGAIADGKTEIQGLLEAEDCLNTIKAFQQLGVEINKKDKGYYLIKGVGLRGLKESSQVIDCGNSGTAMRLLTGLLSAQDFYTVLTGDKYLQKRPMDRIIIPLTQMGAQIWGRQNKYAPLSINGHKLSGIDYHLPVASAQVKTSILLAGLYASGDIHLVEPGQSRDHTERMLKGFGVELIKENRQVWLKKQSRIKLIAQNLNIPGDISSAAFFLAAGLITGESDILFKNVGINSTRSGILEVMQKMGGKIDYFNQQIIGGEPTADILVKSGKLKGITIEGEIIPRLIDEIPIITVLASLAEGQTIIRDAAELRVKETDRIKAMVTELTKLGVSVEELADGMIIEGTDHLSGGLELESYGDHRIAMSLAILGLVTEQGITINESQSINTSFPEFPHLLSQISS